MIKCQQSTFSPEVPLQASCVPRTVALRPHGQHCVHLLMHSDVRQRLTRDFLLRQAAQALSIKVRLGLPPGRSGCF